MIALLTVVVLSLLVFTILYTLCSFDPYGGPDD